MYTVTWIWSNGMMSQYEVETKRQAEMLAIQLYTDELITNVIIDDGGATR